MNKIFDFNTIGKRMPYTTPEVFFSTMEQNILYNTVEKSPSKKKHNSTIRWIIGATVSVAAMALLVFTLTFKTQKPVENTGSMAAVEQAFSQLSPADQAFMKEIYSNDIFLNQ